MIAANANVSPKFLECHAVTAPWEGGWANDPNDPGGKTMYGVTESKFHDWLDRHGMPLRSVRTITHAEALQLFYEDFWLGKISCQNLFPGVDLATYDASVNSGPGRGRKWLLASLDKDNRHDRTVMAICAKRLGFVQALGNWRHFGRGWGNRIADVQAKGVARALAAMKEDETVASRLEALEAEKRRTANKQTQGAVVSGTSGVGAGVTEVSTSSPAPEAAPVDLGSAAADWLLIGVGAALLVLALFLVWRAVLNRQQAKAFGRVAAEANHA